jgi:hypothetical protein
MSILQSEGGVFEQVQLHRKLHIDEVNAAASKGKRKYIPVLCSLL